MTEQTTNQDTADTHANLEDLYELSPMQQGMLFHTLYSPKLGIYIEQSIFTIENDFDRLAFQKAWHQVVARHPILRTGFVWEGLEKPHQIVYRNVNTNIEEHDWREFDSERQHDMLENFIRDDQLRGFDLTRPPLMRFRLFRTHDRAHKFVWSRHHLILDRWSRALVLKDFLTCYTAFCQGLEPDIEETRPYRDYIAWLLKQDQAKAESFWRRSLSGFESPTHIRLGSAPSVQRDTYDRAGGHLSSEETSSLRRFAREQKLTMNTLIQGAWSLLLSRYSGERDVLFGATVAGRPAELVGVDRMVGLFINTLPVRVQVEPRAPLLSWLRTLQENQLEQRQYEHSSLIDIQGWSDIPRGVPLFETILVFENLPVENSLSRTKSNLVMHSDRSVGAKTNYPLTLMVNPGVELTIGAIYDRGHFDADSISQLLNHFLVLLEQFRHAAERSVSEISLLGTLEREQLRQWNETSRTYPQLCIPELFEAQAEQQGTAIAVRCGKEELSYAQLNERANQLAHYLQAQGVGPDVIVGICMDRSLLMVIGLLGILKAGGAYLPLDPAYPSERLRFMLEEAAAPVLLTVSELEDRFPDNDPGIQVVCVDAVWDRIAEERQDNPTGKVTANNLAYVIYTSGSTGKPKGSMITHEGIGNRLLWMQEAYQLTPEDRVLQKTPFTFDVSVWEFFWPLITGARLVMAQPGRHGDSGYLVETIKQEAITTMHFVPSMLAAFLEDRGVTECGSLKRVICSGEALSFELKERFVTRLKAELHNLYGPTEASVDVTYWDCGTVMERPIVPIGRPIANTQLYVLDENLQPLPVGISGELYIGGIGLARGYLKRAELTAERFLPDPFGPKGARIYRTGDLARYLADGNIEYLGRTDHQVKLRGFRIELGEIEAALNEHQAIQQAVVIAREHSIESKRLVAYVVPRAEQAITIDGLRTHLQQSLPDYMIPSAFVVLDILPLTSSGKVNRRQLPAPTEERPELSERFVAPRTALEQEIAGIWEQVLKVKGVGVYDNFFALGGHSLLATRVISRLNESLQIDMPLRALFEHPTVAGIALAAAGHQPSSQDILLRPRPPGDSLPLSFGQERMWFLTTLEPNNPFYNIPRAFRLSGELDVAALEWALAEIVKRHESLRTRFEDVGGVPRQVIDEPGEWKLKLVDLSSKNENERRAAAQRLASEEAERPFVLARDWGLRGQLLRLSESEHLLLLTMHHIVSDGWSLGVLFGELKRLYEAYSRGEHNSALPELGLQYADFAVWQREWLGAAEQQKQLSYWKEQLAGVSPLELPHDQARPAAPSYRGEKQSLRLSAELSSKLQALARNEEATLFMVLLAAFQVLLSRYSGQSDISVGTPIANRTRAQLEELIGYFVNILVLRTDLSGDPSFVGLLQRVREVALAAYAHQDLPFEKLVEELQPERSLSRNPLFDVLFVVQNAPRSEGRLGELKLEPWGEGSKTTRMDLEVHVSEGAQGLVCTFVYATDLFGAETIQRLMGHYEQLLEAVVADAGQRISELALLTSAEREQLRQWNETSSAYPQQCIHELFEAQAQQQGGAIAVRCGGEELSYAELNERANQLAHYLREQGVGAETRVGLCVERSLELVVGLLGILKAGGAYVPLDPVYPRARLEYMVADAGVRLLLTQSSLARTWQGSGLQIVELDHCREEIAGQERSNPNPITAPDNLAYVIYTSGSTGKPKGVLVSHQSVVHLVAALQSQIDFTARDVWTYSHSYGFDFSVWEIYCSLLSGGRLIVVPSIVTQSPSEMIDLLRAEHITIFSQTPSGIRQLIGKDLLTRGQTFDLRLIVCGGEALPQSLAIELLQLQIPLWNFYGPTEATVWATIKQVQPGDTELPLVSIGRPFANIQIYIVDKQLEAVPVGVVGELCISGVGLARGYLNSSELTAQKFIPNPFSGVVGARMYCTGDLARYLPDGNIEFLGRRDNQVKIRGFRIETAEIESSLRQHPVVREAVVTVSDANAGEKRLVAYLMLQADHAVTINELRTHLQQSLPNYMIPSAFVVLDKLPLTASGKVDRRQLPAPDEGRPELGETYVAPRTPLEQDVAGIWEQVLKVKGVGVHDNFFTLGGHSLLATQVISRVNESLQIEMPLRAMFEHPTVARLALAAAQRQAITLEDETIQLLSKLSELSDEEAQQLLESEVLSASESHKENT